MRNNSEIIRKIEDLQRQLDELKLELQQEEGERITSPSPIEVGDSVDILNPRAGQGTNGIVTRINRYTNRITVEARNAKGYNQKVVRAIQNVRKQNE